MRALDQGRDVWRSYEVLLPALAGARQDVMGVPGSSRSSLAVCLSRRSVDPLRCLATRSGRRLTGDSPKWWLEGMRSVIGRGGGSRSCCSLWWALDRIIRTGCSAAGLRFWGNLTACGGKTWRHPTLDVCSALDEAEDINTCRVVVGSCASGMTCYTPYCSRVVLLFALANANAPHGQWYPAPHRCR